MSEFQKGLIRYGRLLKRRAAGRTCGSCRFYVCGLCIEQDIEVNNQDAVACSSHEERE